MPFYLFTEKEAELRIIDLKHETYTKCFWCTRHEHRSQLHKKSADFKILHNHSNLKLAAD
jgi:hypothetical protein